MLAFIRIAAVNPRHGGFGERGLYVHDRSGIGLGNTGLVTDQFKNFLHMLKVALADLLRFRIFFGVVIAVRKSQPALINHRNLLFGIVRVLARSSGKENAARPRAKLKLSHQRRKLAR